MKAEPEAPPPTPIPSDGAAQTDLRALLGNTEAVAGSETTDAVFQKFSHHRFEFMAVLDGTRPIGVCARREIGMLLGGRYGFALYARKPIRSHMTSSSLSIGVDEPIARVLKLVFSRDAASFYDDVILTDERGSFLGLIFVHTLVRLQNSMLGEHVRQLEEQKREINEKNDQMEADLALAREMQLAFLPQQFPAFPPGAPPDASGLHFVHRYLPSTAVSGDFFHVVPLDERRAGVFICDVMGHGVRSALVTAMIRVMVQEFCPLAAEPGALLAQVNRGLMEILANSTGVMFVTAAYAIFDVERRTISYAIAGHPPPFHVGRSTGSAEPLPATHGHINPALGIFPSAHFENYERLLADGDAVLFYTDGLFEVDDRARRQFGPDALLASVCRHAASPLPLLVKEVLADVKAYAAHGFDDDVCILAAGIGPERQLLEPIGNSREGEAPAKP